MATIEPYETKAGKRYKVQYRTPDRRPTTKRGFKRKKDAELFAAQVETTKADGTFISPTAGNITVAKVHELWEHGQKQLSPRSQRNNKSAWNVHVQPKWGDWPVGRITTAEIRKWVVELQKTKGRAHAGGAGSRRRGQHAAGPLGRRPRNDGIDVDAMVEGAMEIMHRRSDGTLLTLFIG